MCGSACLSVREKIERGGILWREIGRVGEWIEAA